MADQVGTPGSNADTSINGGSKVGNAPKDKACPFCNQQFTSSSLGRHLDLYIKEKNPKPPDGLHNLDEIRKMRGGITRRQPRTSIRRREDSTPAGTPGAPERRSTGEESVRGDRSPSLRRDEIGTSNLLYNGKPRMVVNTASWEATGVMNNIPPPQLPDPRAVEGEERDVRRVEGRARSVSRQIIAKSTFDQKQKMVDAQDNARAAELALRELLGSIQAAARKKISTSDIFDYDPLTLDFPALCLHCLPPPPTLHSSTPAPNASCWTVTPPGDAQYEAIRTHFSIAFRNHRNSLELISTAPRDDLSYPPPPDSYLPPEEDIATQTLRVEAEATELEMKINSHIHDVFAVWTSLSNPKRAEIWTLELARSVGRKSLEIQKLKKEKEYEQQKVAHLRGQNDELSRLQQPREFSLVPPQTVPVSQELMNIFGECNTDKSIPSVGYSTLDRSDHLDVVVSKIMGRWKEVVRKARGGSGIAAQRNFSGDLLLLSPGGPGPGQSSTVTNTPTHQASNTNHRSHIPTPNQHQAQLNHNHSTSMPISNGLESIGSDADADADADADMEEDDSYADMTDLRTITTQGHNHGYRLSNGTGKGGNMEGIITQAGGGSGYGRIGT